MKSKCALFIPNHFNEEVKTSNYKSPKFYPEYKSNSSHKKNSVSYTDCDFRRNTSSRSQKPMNYNGLGQDHLNHLIKQKQKVNSIKKTLTSIQDFDIESDIDAAIKKKILENRVLAENIKNLSIKERFNVNESTDDVIKNITNCELENTNLYIKLENLGKNRASEQEIVEAEEIQRLYQENKSLKHQIGLITDTLSKYKDKKVSREDTKPLKREIKLLDDAYAQTLTENSLLQENLIRIKKEASVYSNTPSNEIQSKLSKILIDLSTISSLVSSYTEKKSIDFSSLLHHDYILDCTSNKQYVEKIKKVLEQLRVQTNDLYAEQCGNACYIQ
jgi:hypothetical protein